jgi:hypothetical protein
LPNALLVGEEGADELAGGLGVLQEQVDHGLAEIMIR